MLAAMKYSRFAMVQDLRLVSLFFYIPHLCSELLESQVAPSQLRVESAGANMSSDSQIWSMYLERLEHPCGGSNGPMKLILRFSVRTCFYFKNSIISCVQAREENSTKRSLFERLVVLFAMSCHVNPEELAGGCKILP